MPKPLVTYLDGNNIYICRKCETHLVGLNELVSKAFRGRTGTAYLFNKVQNVRYGEVKEQHMLTGKHRVCSLYCSVCDNDVAIGWKYVEAYEPDQKYKEGRYILQRYYIKKQSWEQEDDIQSD